ERFRNGDPDNDPTPHDILLADPGPAPDGWTVTKWTHDWYRQEDWASRTGNGFYTTSQHRRYGGDLQGVMDVLDYLQELGVTAVYFNPLNDAPSLHKYDARNYRHIDRNFGPDPAGDEAIMAREIPQDPSTWQWTSADSLFLRLVDEMHSRGMRVIVDYSWNHTGRSFWAWQDVVQEQEGSEFADWYEVAEYDDPTTPEDEFSYEGWAGVRSLPELRKVGVPEDFHGGPAEGDLNPGAKALVLEVTRRWLDPNGDGDPSDGIDGFRLDVAEQVPLGFWRDYRDFVKAINPDAYLVGEIWWEQWPERMMDPRPYLGDVFDAVMNYRWYMPTRSLVSGAPPELTPSRYVAHLDSVESGIPERTLRAMMNVAATHDSPRLSTSLYNRGRYKYGVSPGGNPQYRVDRPDSTADRMKRLLLVQQFTYYGAPHIWYGDEVGMWGADDPDTRKPMLWPELDYESEVVNPDGSLREPDVVEVDTSMLSFYQSLARIRSDFRDVLSRGELHYVLVDDDSGLLGYERRLEDRMLLVLLNVSNEERRVELADVEGYRLLLASVEDYPPEMQANLVLPRRTAVIMEGL
ncbi:MAG: alpha-amylase family glycosyl hydrolase, partial [Rhodothermales bacterium]|nr:alpha-amylase family glycosyl hydrolase [Rhodothermales bacterium]